MTGRPTDHRNLDLHQFNLDVAFGRAGGRILWQPRILAWFTDKRFEGEPLPERYREMSESDVYRDLGCSNRVYEYNRCFKREEAPKIIRASRVLDDSHREESIESPLGRVSAVFRGSKNTFFEVQEKHWIESPEDMKVMTWILENSTWSWDPSAFDEVYKEWGDLGAPCMYIPRVNVENLYLDTMGVESAIFALLEWGGVIDDYFRALHENHLRMIEIINASPIELVNFGDNLHYRTLSPSLYEKYVLPVYLDRCERLHSAGKFVYAHWDGDTKALLPYAKTSGLDGIEAITPVPQGDVTLEEVKEALGEEVMLVDGIPAIYFDHTFSEEDLVECTHRIIELFAPNLILGISDEISSTGDLERVRLVGEIVDDYNAAIPTDSPTVTNRESMSSP